MLRTHTCGELNISHKDKQVVLQGWIKKIRKMGHLNFVDLRDRYGYTQLIISEELIGELNIKSEYVVQVTGIVRERKSKNDAISTGNIEIEVSDVVIINESKLPPFQIEDNIETLEDTRMTYRYLDLRRNNVQQKLLMRSKMNNIIRNYFNDENFIEIETPILGKSTPEGARDFLVPSRVNKGEFYALPQSPQLYKQLLMVSGFDRYFQIAKCFRDEDLRIDRQPEFTQLDMEMSFAKAQDIQNHIENVIKKVFKQTINIDLQTPFMRMTYKDAIANYGSDKPDLRFDYKITSFDFKKDTNVNLFKNLLAVGESVVRGIIVDKLLAKKDLEQLSETVKQLNDSKILTFLKYDNGTWSGSMASSLNDAEKEMLLVKIGNLSQATILFICDEFENASVILGSVRNTLGNLLNLKDTSIYKCLWVVDFPLFEWSDEEQRYVAAHHPFTQPSDESLNNFDTDKKNAIAKAYDVVINGFEVGGGSERIYDREVQERMFKAVGLDNELVDKMFGWFINAYKYGAPYHAGCALGLDRLIMLLTGANNIREVIAFPKNSYGIDMLTKAPSDVSERQLEELHINKNTDK